MSFQIRGVIAGLLSMLVLSLGSCGESPPDLANHAVLGIEAESATLGSVSLALEPTPNRRSIHSLSAADRRRLANATLDFITRPILDEHANGHDWHHPANGELFFIRHHDYLNKLESYLRNNGFSDLLPFPEWDPGTGIPSEFLVADPLVSQAPMNSNPNLPLPTRFNNLCAYPDASALAQDIESWHDGVHNTIGGPMSSLRDAPGAPIFWLWHGFLDDIYHNYQACSSPPAQPIPDLQLVGDFMGLGYEQVMYVNRSPGGGKVMVVDYRSGTVPGTVRYWEHWDESSLLNGWLDDNDLHLMGDFMGLGYEQVMHVNRSPGGGKVMMVDYRSGTVPGAVRYWEHWDQSALLNGWLDY